MYMADAIAMGSAPKGDSIITPNDEQKQMIKIIALSVC